MKELLLTLQKWNLEQKAFTLTRVIKTWGSSPRPVGSAMLVDEEGRMAGSVSGGCVEGSVVKSSAELLESAMAKRLHYGVSDEDAWSVGLSCGGKIQVYQQMMISPHSSDENEIWLKLMQFLEHDQDFVLITPLVDGQTQNTLITPQGDRVGPSLSKAVHEAAMEAYTQRNHRVFEEDDKAWFIHVFPRQSQLLIIGSAHITADLVILAKTFGFKTIVIDPRGAFAHKTEYSQPPDETVEDYPSEVLNRYPLDANTYAVILSHDPKIDDNALHLLLRSEVAYIGALGSRKTHEKRTNRLLKAGYSQNEIDRIHAPIGLPIKAKTPREIALSIMGEIIAEKNKYK